MKLPLKDTKFRLLLLAVVLVLGLEILSLMGWDIPMPYAPLLFAGFILSIGYPVLLSGIKALFKFKFSSINLLMLIAVIGAFYLGEYPEAAVVIVLYVLSETLEDIGIKNSKTALDGLVKKAPKMALLKNSDEPIMIDAVKVGDVFLVKPGEMFPLDGKIVSGDTLVDEAAITGEPVPLDKHPGDMVFAGTLNKNGFVEVETSRLSEDSTFSKIVKLTFEAQANRSETQKFIQRFSKVYTPAVIVLSVLLLILSVFVFGNSFDQSLNQAITLLVIACPCALVISTPVAVYSAIGNAYEKGIMVKGGKYLELMAEIKAIALDKTRTITYGKPIVSDIEELNVSGKEELLACASGAEIFSEHPLAQAIVDASRKFGYQPHAAEKFESVIGKGAKAECLVCKDETIYVGKLSYIREYQPVSDQAEKVVERISSEGKTAVVVSFGDGVAGVIGLTDEVKPESKEVINELKNLNIEPLILSGDNTNAVKNLGLKVGIKEVYGGLLPEDKSAKMEELLLRYGKVGMVGDGINDAPALALSTVGIAMGAVGSDTAIETADIVLMNDRLSSLPFLVRLSRATLNRIRFNTIGAVGVKLIFVLLAFMGYSHLVLAIAADVGVTLLVILLSLRLMKFR